MRYAVIIIVNDEKDEFTKDEIRDMVKETVLEYTDNAPFKIDSLEIKRLS